MDEAGGCFLHLRCSLPTTLHDQMLGNQTETPATILRMSAHASLESAKAVVRQYVAAFNAGDMHALRPLFTDDALVHGVFGWGPIDKVLDIWRELHAAFGIQLTVEDIAAETRAEPGSVDVAVRYTERGTFAGRFRSHAPTNKSYEMIAMEWFIIRDGRIARRWGARDSATQARQIGLPLS